MVFNIPILIVNTPQFIADKIPVLIKLVVAGQYKAEFVLGSRVIEGKERRLYLVAEEIEKPAKTI